MEEKNVVIGEAIEDNGLNQETLPFVGGEVTSDKAYTATQVATGVVSGAVLGAALYALGEKVIVPTAKKVGNWVKTKVETRKAKKAEKKAKKAEPVEEASEQTEE